MAVISVLLVEDDEDDYLITVDLLDEIPDFRYSIDWVATPAEARTLMRQNRHDVCLMDYRLGPEEGTDLLAEAADLGFMAPIIMLTGQDDREKDALAMRLGAVDFLVKIGLESTQFARSIRYALARREAESERLKRIQAQSESESKSRFLAHISHEIRTPLTAILGYTELLIGRHAADPVGEGLRVIQRNGQHLRSLLNDVLDFSKIEAGQLEIEIAPIKLADVLIDIRSIFHELAEEKGLEFDIRTASDVPAVVGTDAVRLRQILINLVGNAVKFTEKGDVRLNVERTSEERDSSRYQLAFSISDTGPGVPEAAQALLFKPFAQAGKTSGRAEGTGLGLAISFELAERLSGSIRHEAPDSGGATFVLTLSAMKIPGSDSSLVALPQVDEVPVETPQPKLEGIVLVVDDVSDIRELIAQWVVGTGASVMEAEDGQLAVNMVRERMESGDQGHFSCILMDMQMPVMDGHEASRMIRDLGYSGPIIALTAATLQGDREKCIRSGCDGFLSKPINPVQLRQLLQTRIGECERESDKFRVLLIEDDLDVSEALSFLLQHSGCEVRCAASGQEALKIAANYRADLVLLDLNLPDAHGFDLAPRLRAAGLADARICILSGEEISLASAKSAGADACLLKPVTLSELKPYLTKANHAISA